MCNKIYENYLNLRCSYFIHIRKFSEFSILSWISAFVALMKIERWLSFSCRGIFCREHVSSNLLNISWYEKGKVRGKKKLIIYYTYIAFLSSKSAPSAFSYRTYLYISYGNIIVVYRFLKFYIFMVFPQVLQNFFKILRASKEYSYLIF